MNTVFSEYIRAAMMTERTTHTVRLDPAMTKRLDDEIRRQRQATGDDVKKSDVIRQALERYLAKR